MQLKTLEAGTSSDLPSVILVHGLFGQARNLGVLARRLSADRRVVSVDMRNHGESPHDPDHSYDAMAGDLARVISQTGAPVDVVGHSMGGKAAMWLALTQPDLVRRLVVMDIAPIAYTHTQIRMIDAMQAIDVDAVLTRQQADAALADHVDDPGVRAFLLQSLDLRSTPPEWKLNLETLRDRSDELSGWPDIGGRQFDGPALFLAGADSNYVLPEHEAAVTAAFPQATIQRIAGTGHWLHAERPTEVADAVAAFLA